MDEIDQKRITNNLVFLTSNTNNVEDLILLLVQKGALLKTEKDIIATSTDTTKKLFDLYSLIVKKGSGAYKHLLEALKLSGNWKIVDKLQNTGESKEVMVVGEDDVDSVRTNVIASRKLFEKSKPKEGAKEPEEKESQVRNILSMFQSYSKDLTPESPPESPKEKFKQRVQKAFPLPSPVTSGPTEPEPVELPTLAPNIQEYVDLIRANENWIELKMNSEMEYKDIFGIEAELSSRVDELLYKGNDMVAKSEMTSKEMNKFIESMNTKSGLLWTKLRLLRIELGSKQETFEHFGREVDVGKELAIFPGIDRNFEKSLKYLHLRNVVINGENFVENIKNCSNMEEIRLERVNLRGPFKGRATFPRLALFHIDQIQFKSGNIHDYLQKISPTDSYLFFNKESEVNWSIDQIWTLGVDIKIQINGNLILYVDHEKRELTSMLKDTAAILKNSAVHATRVAVNQSRISHTDLPTQLTELNLYNCDGLYLSTYLSQTLNLTEISIWGGFDKKSLHISTLPKTVKRAALAYMDIISPKETVLELNELYTYRCKWMSGNTDAEEEPFDNLVVKTKRIGIVGGHSGSMPNPNLLRSILETDAEWIFVYDFDWSNKFTEKMKIKQFVSSVGLQGNENGFILKKVRSGEIEKWSGNEVTKDGRNHLEYGHFKWEQFWNSYETSPGGVD